MADIKIKKKGDTHTVIISGRLTVEHAEELRDALVKALKNASDVMLNMDGVTEADLSCLQLLCSVHRTSVAMKKPVKLDHGGPGILKQVAREAGFSRMSDCVQGIEAGCFWRGL